MIITVPELPRLRLDPGVIGLTSGCFDLPHLYHVRYLERCRAQCDLLIVGVDADALIEEIKAKTPVIHEYNRAEMINSLGCVDVVFIKRSHRDFELIEEAADVVFRKDDSLPANLGQIRNTFRQRRRINVPDFDELTSTTAIAARIRRQ